MEKCEDSVIKSQLEKNKQSIEDMTILCEKVNSCIEMTEQELYLMDYLTWLHGDGERVVSPSW